ncbi:MAG: helix-turn-helix domain-containing protein [Oscillospiraceae bacterium]|nr:helix-turn-helix domain-containing protein [Oscillospiraceae bacterium]
MDLNKTGKTIAKLRKQAGLTQAALAEKLGISDKAVSKWERGIACPDVASWNTLSILLDTDIESLIYGHEGRNEWKGVLLPDNSVPASTTVYNKPLIHYLLSQFLLAGINDITVIGDCEPISLPGVNITIADRADRLNRRFTSHTFYIYGNSFIYGPNLTRHFKRAMSRTDGITVISSMKGKGRYPIAVDTDRRAVLSRDGAANQYYAEPFVFVPAGCENSRGSFEGILSGDFNAETMARGMAAFNIGSYEEALRLSEYVRLMESMTGERIGCIEEIIVRRGMAEYEDVRKTCDKGTKEYLEGLFL